MNNPTFRRQRPAESAQISRDEAFARVKKAAVLVDSVVRKSFGKKPIDVQVEEALEELTSDGKGGFSSNEVEDLIDRAYSYALEDFLGNAREKAKCLDITFAGELTPRDIAALISDANLDMTQHYLHCVELFEDAAKGRISETRPWEYESVRNSLGFLDQIHLLARVMVNNRVVEEGDLEDVPEKNRAASVANMRKQAEMLNSVLDIRAFMKRLCETAETCFDGTFGSSSVHRAIRLEFYAKIIKDMSISARIVAEAQEGGYTLSEDIMHQSTYLKTDETTRHFIESHISTELEELRTRIKPRVDTVFERVRDINCIFGFEQVSEKAVYLHAAESEAALLVQSIEQLGKKVQDLLGEGAYSFATVFQSTKESLTDTLSVVERQIQLELKKGL